jgi:hypothetical protein
MLSALFLLAFANEAPSQAPAQLSDPVSTELSWIRSVARTDGEALWTGFGTAPFGFLLIRGEREILLCQPSPPAGFTAAGRDQATGCDRFERPRSGLPDGLLAAMPIFGPPSTIVMGTPEATRLSMARWRSTVLHEHFHQWQASLPEYYARVAALDLAGDDETGMWMLNYAFPYQEAEVAGAYAQAARGLAAALEARGSGDYGRRLADYVALRAAFAGTAGGRHWRYLEFQLWQEGVARWTEIALGRVSSDASMRAEAEAREREVLSELRDPDLARQQRLTAYPMGAGEAMLLEACGPGWRSRYPVLLALGPLLEEAARSCPQPSRGRAT